MIEDIQKDLEKDELVDNTDVIISDEEADVIVSDKLILSVDDKSVYVSFNVNVYPDVVALLTLTLVDICVKHDLELFINEMFVFDPNKDEVVYGEDAKQCRIDNMNSYINNEIWKEKILNEYYGIEC